MENNNLESNVIYALLNEENIVVNCILLNDHDEELIDNILSETKLFSAISCSEFGIAYVGGDFYNGKFYPVKPYPSWIRDEEFKIWKAPIAYPEGGSTYSWDEDQLQWVEASE